MCKMKVLKEEVKALREIGINLLRENAVLRDELLLAEKELAFLRGHSAEGYVWSLRLT
jgi:hypothetical protein